MSPEKGPTLFILPGLPKTGTTFLERNVFSQLSQPLWSFNAPNVLDAARGVAFSYRYSRNPSLADAALDTGASRVLLSYDALCGDPYISFKDHETIIDRLARACDGLSVKILLVVRRQAEWIESMFRQSLHEYYFRSFRKCLVWPEDDERGGLKRGRYPRFAVVELDWRELAADFAGTFGKEAVSVLPYELFVREPDVFIRRLSEFLGTVLERPPNFGVVNRGYGALSMRCALIMNPLLREKSRFGFLPNRPFYYALKARRHRRGYGRLFKLSARLWLRAFLQQTVDRYFWTPAQLLDAGEKERIMSLCGEGNGRLSEYCAVEGALARLGYWTSREGVDTHADLEERARI